MSATTQPTSGSLQRLPIRVPRQHRHASQMPHGIRHRRPRDVSACARLVRRAFFEGQFPGLHEEDPRDWLAAPEVRDAWVAERDGEIVGHVAISRVGQDTLSALRWREVTGHPAAELIAVSRLFVRPQFRGQGLGSSLVDVAVKEARSQGLDPVMEATTTSPVAPSFSHDHGWKLRATDVLPAPEGHHHELWVHRHERDPLDGML